MKGWKKIYASKVFTVPVDQDVVSMRGATARYLRVHVKRCFHTNPEIGALQIVPIRKGKVVAGDTKNSATITCPATPARFVRMTIFESNADAPALAAISVFAGAKKIVPVQGVDVHRLASDDILQISPGDKLTVTYVDETNLSPGRPNALRGDVSATFYNGFVEAIKHFFYEDERGNRRMVDRLVQRVNPGDRFIVQVTDYDGDVTDGADTVPIKVTTSGGQVVSGEATETGPYSGVFTKEVDTSRTAAADALQVKPGDTIEVSFEDKENTDPGNRVARKIVVRVNEPSKAEVQVYESAFGEPQPNPDKIGKSKLVSLERPLVVEVRDPDRARHSADTVTVQLRTTSGAKAEVTCYVGGARTYRREDIATALEKGIFVGEIPLFLGDNRSPDSRPQALKLDTRRFVEGGVKRQTEQPVLNVNGSDIIEAVYADEQSPRDPAGTERRDIARLVTNGSIGVFDDAYEHRIETVHIGENLYIKVEDGDSDRTSERDKIKVTLTSSTGDRLVTELGESLKHSGVFSRAIALERNVKPDPENDKFEADFDASVTITYADARNVDSPDSVPRKAEVKVVIGTDALVLAFAKKYPDDETAVETQFKIGECYYYLGRRHMELAEDEKRPDDKKSLQKMANTELAEGQRI
ncbi:MAG: hypothetical protein HQ582_20615, partial [Planctomycetes bacterium]|nr:hypothetical protein [Planctomycetota bacterium]